MPDDIGVAWIRPLRTEVRKIIVGQDALVHRLLVALLAGGHVLLEGLPGLAKTLVVRTLAQACALRFQRIQFTPDLLPADVIGTMVFNPRTLEFSVHKGPIFANLILADEINRAPAKVQSALLEAMQEHAVTIGHDTHPLEEPFFVLATQNPAEHEGTFPLPEAQLDRFLLKIRLHHPTRAEELEILSRQLGGAPSRVDAVVRAVDLLAARERLQDVFVDPSILAYILDLTRATREPGAFGLAPLRAFIRFGASPRAAVHLLLAARAAALLDGRDYVGPEDVQDLAADVLRHRLMLSFDAEADNVSADDLIDRIVSAVPSP
jgi:MoxR-like ATPase